MRLADRTAIITGGGSGIGRATARRFAAEGASVVVADLAMHRATEVAEEIAAAGGRSLAVTADVSVGGDVDEMVEKAEAEFGGVEILVNNAYSCDADEIVNMEEEEWERDLTVSLTSAFLCSKRVLPGMVERSSGVILNLASVNAILALGNEAYSAAKAGIVNLTQSIAVRYGPNGVRANAIAPGTVRTPAWAPALEKTPAIFDELAKWYPLGRVGEPEDVAAAAAFLASDDAAWITGTVLRVDGGLTAGNHGMTQELLSRMDE